MGVAQGSMVTAQRKSVADPPDHLVGVAFKRAHGRTPSVWRHSS
ncbi:hypothetical protein H4W81_002883 [Nonomuraea africana]|uniref:Uncharacterized protein n=1 Tax=Nonomuraea africana TaxID=46171 RepID=A0ABR9KDL7_9ACTN|nr:hypothetical protein [Nonomuraea africana]